jgi:hypothetical protein
MGNITLEPILKSFNFWDLPDESLENFESGVPEFFAILFPDSGNIASLGWWNGSELIWLVEYYHASGNDLVFYVIDLEGSFDEVSPEEWFSYVLEKTPEAMPWILFRLPELNLA